MTFTNYLEQKKLSGATVNSYSKYMQYFTGWLQREDLTSEEITYTELLDFVRYLQAKSKSKRTINHLLGIVRHYFAYLVTEGKRSDNPAAGLFIKGVVRKLPHNILSQEELQELYRQYSIQLNVDMSKKIMLGLLVYQGLTTDEIIRLELQHISVAQAKVFIKGTKRTAERWLELQAVQISQLQAYLSKNKFKEGSLLLTGVNQKNISNRMQHMTGQLRKLNPKLINAQQIRSSVITHWLKTHNLRQVQYMAGHKYVSSTQRYQVSNLDELQNQLQQHHPMS